MLYLAYNMRRIFLVFLILTLTVLVGNSVFASPPLPSPNCYIKGIIQSVEFKEAYEDPCLTGKYKCPTDIALSLPARYAIKIKIDSVAYDSGETKFITCETLFPLNAERTIFIKKDKVKAGDSFKSGQKISGRVTTYWYEGYLSSYILEDNFSQCTVDSDCYPESFTLRRCGKFYTCYKGKCYEGRAACPASIEQVKITPKEALSKTTEITIVREIELREEATKLIYFIKGIKQARLLFIIPISLEVEIKVDAETGNVISINKPWWSFLTY